jgi:hypothetical protein
MMTAKALRFSRQVGKTKRMPMFRQTYLQTFRIAGKVFGEKNFDWPNKQTFLRFIDL